MIELMMIMILIKTIIMIMMIMKVLITCGGGRGGSLDPHVPWITLISTYYGM